MITLSLYTGQTVGVVGLGKAGEAAVAALAAGGARVLAWDDQEASRKRLSGVTVLPPGQWPWAEVKALVLSPGVPKTHPRPHRAVEMAQRHGCPVIGEVELLYRACPNARYVAITGTNGKSTTTTLIGHILKSAGLHVEIGGNLGVPALALAPLGEEGVYVLEMSSYQLDLVDSARFNVAVFLNVTPDHLDRHGDMDGYIAAKMHIFDHQQAADTAVVAVDDEYTRAIAGKLRGMRLAEVSCGALPHGIGVKDGMLYDHGVEVGDLNAIPTLTGRHNWQNAAAAYAAARASGVPPAAIYRAMRDFPGLRHRLQLAATIRGVRFINDSKATNADATANALAPYEAIYWIAGGKPKSGGIASLEAYFPRIAHAFLIGEAEEEFAAALQGKVPFTRCGTLHNAVNQAASRAFAEGRKQAVVLLSPACASFDQWKNFEERGDAFCAMVEELARKEQAGAVKEG